MLRILTEHPLRHLRASQRKLRLALCALAETMSPVATDEQDRRDAVRLSRQWADAEEKPEWPSRYNYYPVLYDDPVFGLRVLTDYFEHAGSQGKIVDIFLEIFGNPFRFKDFTCPFCEGASRIDLKRWLDRQDFPPDSQLAAALAVALDISSADPSSPYRVSPQIPCKACKQTGFYVPSWLTPTVRSIAEEIYTKQDYTGIPILADALEEAGLTGDTCPTCKGQGSYWVCHCFMYECAEFGDPNWMDHCSSKTHETCRDCGGTRYATHPILEHLRKGKSHAQGCWVIDLLTERT